MRSYATSRPRGECARQISEPLKTGHPEVDWRGILGFRNVLVHDYLAVDLNGSGTLSNMIYLVGSRRDQLDKAFIKHTAQVIFD